MNLDEWGEVINGEETYKGIAEELHNKSVLIGWTDGNGTHFDILFTYRAYIANRGTIQGGVKQNDLIF